MESVAFFFFFGKVWGQNPDQSEFSVGAEGGRWRESEFAVPPRVVFGLILS